MSVQHDRLTFIIHTIDEWAKNDPKLENKLGFLEYLETQEIGKYKVKNIDVWLTYYHEARKKRISIAELLFFKVREGRKSNSSEESERPLKVLPIDVVPEDKMKELKKMTSRLKSHSRKNDVH
ncbi:MAG: hypothetical protein JSV27_00930 [Candidatus Bathyarchaeota archaeon]|nr:MAG: hypothetical protein JSV27_00930 [Candidatus Bathyarchaeota archaeon]